MANHAKIEIRKSDSGKVEISINSNMNIADIILAFAILTQKLVKGEFATSSGMIDDNSKIESFESRLKRQ